MLYVMFHIHECIIYIYLSDYYIHIQIPRSTDLHEGRHIENISFEKDASYGSWNYLTCMHRKLIPLRP